MSPEDTVDAITARLNGHDPKEWFDPARSVSPPGDQRWCIIRKDTHLEYFDTEDEAWRFKRTGVRP